MDLRSRVLRSVGFTVLALGIGVYTFGSGAILSGFVRLEREDAQEGIERVQRSFEQMVGEVHSKTSDWASWDDAYAFMKDRNPAFVRSNLSAASLAGLHVDSILFLDPAGRVVRSQNVGSEAKVRTEDVLAAIRRNRVLSDPEAARVGRAGYVLLPSGPMLISVRPILTSAGGGPARGWLVFGRVFGGHELSILRGMTRLDVSLQPLYGNAVPQGPRVATRDESTVVADTIVPNLSGRPYLRLKMRKPRLIYGQGLAMVHGLGLLTAALGVVFGAVIAFVLERAALSRIARLSREVEAIGDLGEGAAVTAEGDDELGRLAERVNAMLAKLHEREITMHEQNADLEKAVLERTRQMEHQAFHDKLTGLANRALFNDRVGLALAKIGRSGRGMAAFFIDLDNFKVVNDSLGHSAGDALLVGLAKRLEAQMRPGDTVARLGGDEFTVLLEDLGGIHEAEEVAGRIMAAFRDPFDLEGREVFVGGSIGIAYAADEGTPVDTIIRNADTAMYRAKVAGKGHVVVYDETMSDHIAERMEIEMDLRRALEGGEIEVHYQPLIDLKSGRLKGAEALVRWNHPTRGVVRPDDFIPVAEETGIIVPIGFWVLEEACRQAVEWIETTPHFEICVNLSGRQLQRDDLVLRVAEILDRTGLPPSRLELEITETMLMTGRDDVVGTMQCLKALGVRLALDDFGTGYSSLATLSSFPIDTLKIDRAFISRLDGEKESKAIVEAIMALSKTMQMDVIGEGVETDLQHHLIRKLGCQTGQGYLFDKPLSAEAFGQKLAEEEPGDAFEFRQAA